MSPEVAELLQSIAPVVLGQRIKNARVAAGLTQAELSEAAGTPAYLSRIEDGQRRPSSKMLTAWAARLGVEVDVLVTGVSDDVVLELRAALDQAELSLASGDAPAALRAVDALLANLDGHIPAMVRAGALRVKAFALEATGDLQAAILLLEDLSESAVKDASWLRILIALSRCYRDSGELDRAIKVGERAQDVIAELELEGLTEAIQLTMTVAGAYMVRGDVEHAMRLCVRAIDAAERHDSAVGKASAYWNASLIEIRRGNFQHALEMSQRALALFELGDDARNISRLRVQVANLQMKQSPPAAHEAIELLRKAELEAAWAPVTAVDVARQNLALAQAHLLLGDSATASVYIGRAKETALPGAPILLASIHVLEGQLFLEAGEKHGALEAYRAAIAALTGIGADREAAQLWFELGTRLMELGERDEALEAFRRAGASTGLAVTHGAGAKVL